MSYSFINCTLSFDQTIFTTKILKLTYFYLFKISKRNGGILPTPIFLLLKKNCFSCSDEELKFLHINITSSRLSTLFSQRKTFCINENIKAIPTYHFGKEEITEATLTFNIYEGKLYIHKSAYAELLVNGKIEKHDHSSYLTC